MPTSFIQLAPDSTGKKLKTYDEGTEGHTKYLRENEPATFWAVYDRIAVQKVGSKYMATLWNGAAGRIVGVKQIWRSNWQVAGASGLRTEQELRRISALTAGTSVTPAPTDSNNTLTAGVTATYDDTLATEADLLLRFFAIDEEMLMTAPATTATQEGHFILGMLGNDRGWQMVWDKTRGVKDLLLRTNQGVTIKSPAPSTAVTTGSISYRILFTDEPA